MIERRLPIIIRPPATTWTSKDVIQALRDHFFREIWNIRTFRELELEPHPEDDKYHRRADLLAIFPTGVHHTNKFVASRKLLHNKHHDPYLFNRLPEGWRTGFEIKVNRLDLISDLKQRWKQNPLARICNEVYFICPRGLIKHEPKNKYGFAAMDVDLPWGMGLIEVYRDDRARWKGALRAELKKLSKIEIYPETPPWFLNRLLLSRRG